MAIILNIETATKNCSVSIANNGAVLVLKELNDLNYSHAEKLHPFINAALKEANLTINEIDAVAVSKGPGSYTGLRIGVSAAKGICFAIDKPLISIDTLTSLSNAISIDAGVVVPMLDARRMEVYAAVFSADNKAIREIKAEIIDTHSFSDYLEKGNVYFLGDGAKKCQYITSQQGVEQAIFKYNASNNHNGYCTVYPICHSNKKLKAQKSLKNLKNRKGNSRNQIRLQQYLQHQ